MAYQYGSTSSLHLSDLNNGSQQIGNGYSGMTSYHSTSNVGDGRHQPYHGYQPTSLTSSRDDVSELFWIPGQENLMRLQAKSRFSYAYGETADQKYRDGGIDDEIGTPRSHYSSQYDTPRSRYSYAEPVTNQYAQDPYNTGNQRSVATSRESVADRDYYANSGRQQEPYPKERTSDTYGEGYSMDQNVGYTGSRDTYTSPYASGNQMTSHGYVSEFSNHRVNGLETKPERGQDIPSYSSTYQSSTYRSPVSSTTHGPLTDQTSYAKQSIYNGRDSMDYNSYDYGRTSGTSYQGSTQHKPEYYDYRDSESRQIANGDSHQDYVDRTTLDPTLKYSHVQRPPTPNYVPPPAYKKVTDTQPYSSTNTRVQQQVRNPTELSSAGYHSGEYSQQSYPDTTYAESYRSYQSDANQYGGVDDRVSPYNSFSNSGSSGGQSQYSAVTTATDASAKEQTWTYSGAIIVNGDKDTGLDTYTAGTVKYPNASHTYSGIDTKEKPNSLTTGTSAVNYPNTSYPYSSINTNREELPKSTLSTSGSVYGTSSTTHHNGSQMERPIQSLRDSYAGTESVKPDNSASMQRSRLHSYGVKINDEPQPTTYTHRSPSPSSLTHRSPSTSSLTHRSPSPSPSLSSLPDSSRKPSALKKHTYAQTSPVDGHRSPAQPGYREMSSPQHMSNSTQMNTSIDTSQTLRRSSSIPRVTFDTDDKENIQVYGKTVSHHNNLNGNHDSSSLGNSLHGNSPRGLCLSDLSTSRSENSPTSSQAVTVTSELARPSGFTSSGSFRQSNIAGTSEFERTGGYLSRDRLRQSNTGITSELGGRPSGLASTSSFRQTNTATSPSKLSSRKSQSMEKLFDGKSTDSSQSVKQVTPSLRMSSTSSRELSASALQQFKKRISKPQVQTNVPIYPSTHLRSSGSHDNRPAKVTTTAALGSSSPSPSKSQTGTKTASRMSSALWALKLIELLHSSPVGSHEELVVQARWFRKWYTNVRLIKRQRIEENQHLEEAAVFWRRKLLKKCLRSWRDVVNLKQTAAEDLYHRHMMRKGLEGLKYAVSERQHQCYTVKSQQTNRLLLRHFATWKDNYQEQRYETIRHAFLTWQQFKLDMDKYKELSHRTNKRRITDAFSAWRDKHTVLQQDGLANLHYKVNLLAKGFQNWRLYTADRRVKTTQNEMAKVYYREKTVVKFYQKWKTEYQKFQVAKTHHSDHLLSLTFSGWRRSLQVLRAERLHDVSAAKEFNRKALLKIYFVQWNLKLKETTIKTLSNRNTLKRFFETWYLKQQRLAIQKQIEESMARKTLKRQTLYLWLMNVRKQKERREKFIAVVERIHTRQAFQDWRNFTTFKIKLREKMMEYQEIRDQRLKHRCYQRWTWLFSIRQDQHRARQAWSRQCAIKAYHIWKELVRRQRLEKTLANTQPIRDKNVVRAAFMKWKMAKESRDWDSQRVESVQLILQHNCLHRILAEWRILCKQSQTIQPFIERRHRRLVLRTFDAWREIITRKHQCQDQYAQHQQHQLNGAFSAWREKAELLQREKEVANEILQSKLRRCMQGWHGVAQRTVHCNMFVEQTQHSKLQLSFDRWKQSWEDLVEKRDDMEAEKAQGHIFKSVYLKKWQDSMVEQQNKMDECVKSFGKYQDSNSVKGAFFNWKQQYIANKIAQEYHEDSQRRKMGRIVHAWNDHSKQSFQDSVDRFTMNLGGPSSPTLSIDSNLSQSTMSQISEPISQNSSGFHSNVPLPSTASSNNGNHANHVDGNAVLHEEAYRWDNMPVFPHIPGRARSDSYASLYSDSLHVEVPQNRRAMLRRVILHWKLWPASTAFHQWLAYTRKQKLLRQLQYQTQYTSMLLVLKHGLQQWKRQYMASVTATSHWETNLKRKCLRAWLYYKIDRKRKTHKKDIADRHADSGMLTRAFIVWRQRTAERLQMLGIVENWQDYVSENVRMEGRARKMRQQIALRTIKECFSVWKIKLQQLEKVDQYYNNVVIRKTFCGWFEVVKERREQRRKMKEFLEKRQKKMVFYRWQLRLSQKEVVEYRYQVIMQMRLKETIQRWHCWAIQNKMRNDLCQNLTNVFNIRRIHRCWRLWRQETHRIQQMNVIYQGNLMTKCLKYWHIEVKRRQDNKRKCEEYKEVLAERSVAKVFKQWCVAYRQNQIANQFRQQVELRVTRQRFQAWREYTLEERSSKHYALNTLAKCFSTWREHIIDQKRLKTKLKSVVLHWRQHTKRNIQLENVASQYCQRCRDLQLRTIFRKWVENTEKCQISRDFYNTSLQRRCFTGWLQVIRIKVKHRKMMRDFQEKAMIRQMGSLFDIWKKEYRMAESRTELVDQHMYRRDRQLLKQAMQDWRQHTRDSKADSFIRRSLLTKMWTRWKMAQEYNRKAEEFAINKQTKTQVAMITFWNHWAKGSRVRAECSRVLVRSRHIYTLQATFRSWKTETEKRQQAREHYTLKLKQKTLQDWYKTVRKEKKMAEAAKIIVARREKRIVRTMFTKWKREYQHRVWLRQTLDNALEKRRRQQLTQAFLHWRKEILEQKATRHRTYLLQKHTVQKWKTFTKQRKAEKQNERDMEDLADYHYNTKICKKIVLSWKQETKMMKFVKGKHQKTLQECWNIWKSAADKEFTAKLLARHKLCNMAWSKWRKAFIQVRVAKAMTSQDNKHLRSEAFNGWRRYTEVHHIGNIVADSHEHRQLQRYFNIWKDRYNMCSSSAMTSYSSAPGNLSSSSSETLSVTWN
ncbi:uncharacterized protein LOC144451217 [Glandiceps talaboti]